MKYPGGNMSIMETLSEIISKMERKLVRIEKEYRENYSGSYKIIYFRGEPYIYRTYKENGRWRTKYIGKGDEKRLQQLKKRQQEMRKKIKRYREILKHLREAYELLEEEAK